MIDLQKAHLFCLLLFYFISVDSHFIFLFFLMLFFSFLCGLFSTLFDFFWYTKFYHNYVGVWDMLL